MTWDHDSWGAGAAVPVVAGQGEGGEVLTQSQAFKIEDACQTFLREHPGDTADVAADEMAEALLPLVAALLSQARADTERRWKDNAEAIGRALDQAEDQLRNETRQLRERVDELVTELDGARRATEMAAADLSQARADGAAEERRQWEQTHGALVLAGQAQATAEAQVAAVRALVGDATGGGIWPREILRALDGPS